MLHYDLVEKLGFGGAGEVYKAVDKRLGRIVALKFINPAIGAHSRVEEMLIAEARIASRLDHRNIGTIFEIGHSSEDRPYIAMAYYEGHTLQKLIRSGRVPVDQIMDYAIQMAEGLAYAHAHGVVHRDIKPSNVMVTNEGVVKIIDFGLARAQQDPEVTMTLGFLGTPAYMSPEQAAGLPADHRADIWAWGLILYEMLTGVQPFSEHNIQATLYAVLNKHAQPILHLRPETPPDFAAVVSDAIEKRLERRLSSISEALRRCRGLPPGASPISSSPIASPITSSAATQDSRHPTGSSVAVLPLKNLAGDEEGEMFSEGLSEELINALAKLTNIRVLARTSTFQLKDSGLTPKEIRARLGATHVIDGSVRKQGHRVRVLVRLTNTAEESVEWSERYDRELEDVFAIQDEIGAAVAQVLHVSLSEGVGVRIHTRVPAALDMYLRGRYQVNRSNPVELANAIRSFEEATRLDPNFALAYANLADAYLIGSHWSVISLKEARVRALAAARKAMELGPNLAEANAAMAAAVFADDWSNFPQAAAGFERAIQLNPNYAPAYFWYGQIILRPLGRIQEALAAGKKAVQLDPLSPAMRVASAYTYFYSGNFDHALREARKCLELDPNYSEATYLMGMANIAAGHPEEAVTLMQDSIMKFGERPWQLSELGVAYARLGKVEEARAILAKIETAGRTFPVSPMVAGYVHMALSDYVEAGACMEQAFESRDYRLLGLIGNPVFPEIFTDPGYAIHAQRLREFARLSSTTQISQRILTVEQS